MNKNSPPKFPTSLRKMWSGTEVQAWIDEAWSRAAAEATPAPATPQISIESAQKMGSTGAPASEEERLLFEAWMRGHCWAVEGDWNGETYLHPIESKSKREVHYGAMYTRALWAAFRDRAALGKASGEGAEYQEARQGMRQILAVAVMVLYESCREDVEAAFSVSELEEMLKVTEHLKDERVELLYKKAWLALGGSESSAIPEQAPDGWNAKRIGWELERTALGDGHFGNALRAAKDFPFLKPEDLAVLDRYAAGGQRGMDHVQLQDIALRVYAYESESSVEGKTSFHELYLSLTDGKEGGLSTIESPVDKQTDLPDRDIHRP